MSKFFESCLAEKDSSVPLQALTDILLSLISTLLGLDTRIIITAKLIEDEVFYNILNGGYGYSMAIEACDNLKNMSLSVANAEYFKILQMHSFGAFLAITIKFLQFGSKPTELHFIITAEDLRRATGLDPRDKVDIYLNKIYNIYNSLPSTKTSGNCL